MAAKPGASRLKSYKTKGLDLDEIRRRNEEDSIELRRSRRDEQLFKRRHITNTHDLTSDNNNDQHYSTIYSMDTPIELLARGLFSTSQADTLSALHCIRLHLCAKDDPPISRVIDCGILPKLIELLQTKYQQSELQFEVCWILTNICGGTSYHTRSVIECGGIVPLVSLMASTHVCVQEQAIWALSNIAGDCIEFRNIVLQSGIIEPILILLMDDDVVTSLQRNCVWLMANLCRGKKPLPNEQMIYSSLHVLARTLYSDDINILSDGSWTIAYLSEGSDKRIECVINSGVVMRLVELLMHPNTSVVIPSLRAIGNILTGSDPLAQVVINCSVLPVLKNLITSSIDQIKKETCWALSNITAGNKVQIQAVIDSNVIPLVLEVIDSAQYKIRKEAAWIVLNAIAGGTNEQIINLVNIGVIKPLCDLLSVQDNRVLLVTLEGLECILKVGVATSNDYPLILEQVQGIEKIELLMDHFTVDISNTAQRLLDKYINRADSTTVDY